MGKPRKKQMPKQKNLFAKATQEPIPSKVPTKTETLVTAQELADKQNACLTAKAMTNAATRERKLLQVQEE